ncbi:Aste57867_6933 [Aphanomyces stellatus]|uniref:Aste57867_6933 protein n=1 Tax=Aphanomyces stellatus TaxID=120398 RepID=A0A485KG74_9STRA|nr:hypothetical protein As57867_006911 [Aphanomyces stellatus]VFT83885.1 Aste57867_6933 [Aphanomyces stellatus]
MMQHNSSSSNSAMLQLSDEDMTRMRTLGREVCTHVAISSRRSDSGRSGVRWNPAGFEHQVEIFVGEDANGDAEGTSNRSLSYMCGVVQVAATIDQIADLFNADPSSDGAARDFYDRFHQDFAHTQLLAAIRTRSRQYPRHTIGLKTATMLSPHAGASSRDFVYLECQEDVMDARRNKRGWVCAMHSIDLPNVPQRHDTVRGSLYRSGFVFTESDTPGVLEAVYLLQVDFKGPVAVHVRQAMMKQRILCLQVLADHFHQGSGGGNNNQAAAPALPQASSRDSRFLNEDMLAQANLHQQQLQQQQQTSSSRYTNQGPSLYPTAAADTHPRNLYPDNHLRDTAVASTNPHRSLSSHSSGLHLLGDIHLKPKHAASQCACCVSSFGFLKKKHNCRVCGEVVCSSCCTQQRPVVPIEGIKKYHICTLCTMDNPNRRSVARTASSQGRSKSEHNSRSVLSNAKSPKSSLSGSHPLSRQHKHMQQLQLSGGNGISGPVLRQRPDVHQSFDEMTQPPPTTQHVYGKSPSMPQASQSHQLHRGMMMAPALGPAASLSAPAAFQQSAPQPSGGGRYRHDTSRDRPHPMMQQQQPPPSSHHHQFNPPQPRYSSRYHDYDLPQPHHQGQQSSYPAPSVASSNHPPLRYNGQNRPDDPRDSMRFERESFLNLYDEVGTSVSRALPPPNPPASYRHHAHLPAQVQYVPADAPNTTAINLGDLRNAPDVLAALNNNRNGKESTLRLEIVAPTPSQVGRPPHVEPEIEPTPATAALYAPPDQPAMRPYNPQAPTPDGHQLVAQPAPPGIYKGSRYRIKETRYYAPTPDASADEYVAQERDSILVDMPSQPQLSANAVTATNGGNNASPTALTVSRFLDQDIDMFLQPMDKKKAAAAAAAAQQVNGGGGGVPLALDNTPAVAPPGPVPNFSQQVSMDDLIAQLQAQQPPPVAGESMESDVATLTRLLMERLRVASESEREAVKATLTQAVTQP